MLCMDRAGCDQFRQLLNLLILVDTLCGLESFDTSLLGHAMETKVP